MKDNPCNSARWSLLFAGALTVHVCGKLLTRGATNRLEIRKAGEIE